MILRAIRLEVFQLRDPQGHVKAVLHGIEQVVAEHELELKLGIFFHELGEHRPEPHRAERHRCIDAQQPARRRLGLRHRLIGGLDLREDHDRTLEILLTVLCRTRTPRGPVQELHAEALLEVSDIFADRRARQPQLAAGIGKNCRFRPPSRRPGGWPPYPSAGSRNWFQIVDIDVMFAWIVSNPNRNDISGQSKTPLPELWRTTMSGLHHVTAIAGDPIRNFGFIRETSGCVLSRRPSISTIPEPITSITATRAAGPAQS